MKLSDENDIGYPSFESKDNDARYVPEYDYILQFEKDPPANAYFKPVQWPESQPYLFPSEPKPRRIHSVSRSTTRRAGQTSESRPCGFRCVCNRQANKNR